MNAEQQTIARDSKDAAENGTLTFPQIAEI
jgi:hypothetical protein